MSLFPPEVKKQINSFRCPVCACGLDGRPWSNIKEYHQVILYCVQNPQHFFKELSWYGDVNQASIYAPNVGSDVPIYIRDVLILYSKSNRFTIEKRYVDNKVYHTRLYYFPADEEGRSKEGVPGKQITIEEDLFDFSSFSHEEYLDKINTIIMFQ